MRFTFLTPADSFTGGTRVIATYAQQLLQRGHTVTVVSNAPAAPDWRDRWRAWRRGEPRLRAPAPGGHLANSGVPHRVLERPRPITTADVPDADVVIATWWETAVWMHALPRSKGRPAHLIQGYEVWTGGDVGERVNAALRLPNRKIVVSGALARDLEGAVGHLGWTVVPNAVDLRLFDAPPRDRSAAPTVGFIYARSPIKGADRCAQAIGLARQALPGLRVLAFGVDRPTPDWPLPPGTEFVHLPAPDAIPGLYARCDAWLFGSRLDSFGLPILEAMACRTPVVGVPIGAAPELLREGGGVLLPDSEPETMAAGLLSLLKGTDSNWRRSSDQAHQKAHGYSWDDATDLLLQALGTDPPAAAAGHVGASASPAGHRWALAR